MDTVNKLELFKSEFERWQKKLGLVGYKCFFKYRKLSKCYANIVIDQESMVVAVNLSKSVSDKDIIRIAKHEATHLLIGRLNQYALSRHASSEDIFEASEELANKLENLIK